MHSGNLDEDRYNKVYVEQCHDDNSGPKRRFIGKIGEHDSAGSSIVLDGELVDVSVVASPGPSATVIFWAADLGVTRPRLRSFWSRPAARPSCMTDGLPVCGKPRPVVLLSGGSGRSVIPTAHRCFIGKPRKPCCGHGMKAALVVLT